MLRLAKGWGAEGGWNLVFAHFVFRCCSAPLYLLLLFVSGEESQLAEASCDMIGSSICHSAPGTLPALIRSLGSLTSQGWMLQQSADQMTAPCFVGTFKGGGRRQRKGICLVSAAFFLHTFGAFVSVGPPHKCNNVHCSSFVLPNARGEFSFLWVNLISVG